MLLSVSLMMAAALLPPHTRTPQRMLPRREALLQTSAAAFALCSGASPATALIKGSAPPPKSGPKERKCKSIDECEALGDKQRAAQEAGLDTTILRTVGGDRYRDISVGDGKAVANGDAV